jgi:hypothetical protein
MDTMIADNATASWVAVIVAGIFFGGLFGAILGLAIGQGVSEEDTYLYDDSLLHGSTLLRLLTDSERAGEAARILHQISAAAKARPERRAEGKSEEAESAQAS